jgi:hypothetical protein
VAPEEVPEESKFLLEVDFARLCKGDLTSQHYWVHAVKAAVKAGQRKGFLRRRAAPPLVMLTSGQPPIPFAPTDDTSQTDRGTAQKRVHKGSGSIDDMSNKHRRPD